MGMCVKCLVRCPLSPPLALLPPTFPGILPTFCRWVGRPVLCTFSLSLAGWEKGSPWPGCLSSGRVFGSHVSAHHPSLFLQCRPLPT